MLAVPNIDIDVVSGHAMQIKDLDGDELDGFDECSWFFFVEVTPKLNGNRPVPRGL